MSDDHRYDQEIGGNGQYRSEFGPQVLDFAFARYESARQPFFDEMSATISINRQDDGRLTQVRPGQRIDDVSDHDNRRRTQLGPLHRIGEIGQH